MIETIRNVMPERMTMSRITIIISMSVNPEPFRPPERLRMSEGVFMASPRIAHSAFRMDVSRRTSCR